MLQGAGDAASISVHEYDRYQVDTNGAPIAGHGVSQTFSYDVVDGAAEQGPAFGAEMVLGASSGWDTANPALAALGDGGFVTVWQGLDAGGGIWDGFGVDDKAGANGHDALLNIERIRFGDRAAGQAYRLHQAALDRTPDLAGLGYWIAQMDRGLALNDAAAAFSASLEFGGMSGAHSTDAQFVDLLYQNVLHRPPVTLTGWSRLAPTTWRAKPCSGYSAKASRTRRR